MFRVWGSGFWVSGFSVLGFGVLGLVFVAFRKGLTFANGRRVL